MTVPYFDKLSVDYVCGGQPDECQPTSSRQYVSFSDQLDYDGTPGNYLGLKFEPGNFYNAERCVGTPLAAGDVIVSGRNVIKGSLKENTKKDFSNKVSADVIELLSQAGVTAPLGLEAEIENELSYVLNQDDTSDIELEYKRIDLSRQYILDVLPEACLNKTSDDLLVSTGISVMTVSGSWTSDKVAEALARVEANASYRTLSDDAKANWERTKDRYLAGEFDPVSFVFIVAYRPGKIAG